MLGYAAADVMNKITPRASKPGVIHPVTLA